MKIFYRVSNSSYNKIKVPGSSKENCLKNFIDNFSNSEIYIVADNVHDLFYEEIKKICDGKIVDLFRTKNSNAGSLIWSIKKAINISNSGEMVYFCEDDYFHRNGCEKALKDGLALSDYVTLYDHPDKYQEEYNMGEFSWVCKTENTHWRTTISTCMTFGSNTRVLAEDLDVWEKWTKGTHPHDHQIFVELNKEKKRNLIVSIPGLACHLDMTYPLQKGNYNLIEPWAMEIAENYLKQDIKMEVDVSMYSGMTRLMLLETLLKESSQVVVS